VSGADAAGRCSTRRAWLAQDPDELTRAELTAIVDAAADGDEAASADLADRFGTPAVRHRGLRGRLGAGSNRMNRVLVSQAAAGFAAYLREKAAPGTAPLVVVGYDGRRIGRVRPRLGGALRRRGPARGAASADAPHPVLAFAVRHLGAAAASW
jgi:phosphomannomutase